MLRSGVLSSRGLTFSAPMNWSFHIQGSYVQRPCFQGSYVQLSHIQGSYILGSHIQESLVQGSYVQWSYVHRPYLQGSFIHGFYLLWSYVKGSYILRTFGSRVQSFPRVACEHRRISGRHFYRKYVCTVFAGCSARSRLLI